MPEADPRAVDRGRGAGAYAALRTRPLLVDGVLAVVFGAITVFPAVAYTGNWVSLLLVLPLTWRRVRPVASTGAVAVGALVQVAVVPDFQAADGAVLLSLYSVVAYGPHLASRGFTALAAAGGGLAGVRWSEPDIAVILQVWLVCLVAVIAAAAAGEVRRLVAEQGLDVLRLTERQPHHVGAGGCGDDQATTVYRRLRPRSAAPGVRMRSA